MGGLADLSASRLGADAGGRSQVNMKGIIFDMDGVLTDSSPIHDWAFRETLRPYGIVVDYRRIAGMRTRDAIAMLLAENDIHGVEPERLAAAKSEAALRRSRLENPVVPGALDV